MSPSKYNMSRVGATDASSFVCIHGRMKDVQIDESCLHNAELRTRFHRFQASNWLKTRRSLSLSLAPHPCCFLNLPVETARALQMSTAVPLLPELSRAQISARAHARTHERHKSSTLVPSRRAQIALSSQCLFIYVLVNLLI